MTPRSDAQAVVPFDTGHNIGCPGRYGAFYVRCSCPAGIAGRLIEDQPISFVALADIPETHYPIG